MLIGVQSGDSDGMKRELVRPRRRVVFATRRREIELYLSAIIRPPHGTVRQRWSEKIALSLSAWNGKQNGLFDILKNGILYYPRREYLIIK